PAGLPAGQDFRSRKIFKIFMVHDDVDRSARAFKVVTPMAEHLVDSQQFLIMGVIVEFRGCQGSGVEHNGTEFLIRTTDGEDSCDGIVQSIGLDSNGTVRNPMSKDGCCGKGFLEFIESRTTGVVKGPGSVFSGEVIENEATIKIGEPEEGLDVLHFARFGPIPNCLDFLWGHCQTRRGKTITKVLNGVCVPFALLGFHVKSVFA
ncbi:hypothetical protein PAXINDRAFT_69045, partial [Paxillus involutus ATCC 200175]